MHCPVWGCGAGEGVGRGGRRPTWAQRGSRRLRWSSRCPSRCGPPWEYRRGRPCGHRGSAGWRWCAWSTNSPDTHRTQCLTATRLVEMHHGNDSRTHYQNDNFLKNINHYQNCNLIVINSSRSIFFIYKYQFSIFVLFSDVRRGQLTSWKRCIRSCTFGRRAASVARDRSSVTCRT